MIAIKYVIAWVCMFTLILSIECIRDEDMKIPSTTVPQPHNDGWVIATASDEGISQDSLDKVYNSLFDQNAYYNALGLIVVHDGKLVFETYCRDPQDIDRPNHVQSTTKSITSLAIGLARSKGHLANLDEKLYTYFPDKFDSDVRKREITLRHLMTMRSGLEFFNDVFAVEITVDKPHDEIAYILHKPLFALPGDTFVYRDCDPQLISCVIQKELGVPEDELVNENIFKPLGITNFYWQRSPQGFTLGAHGLHLRLRDMAKIGQLLLQRGRWIDKQIIDSSWIDSITKPHQVYPRLVNSGLTYGYYWWGSPRFNGFTSWGHGGQFITVIPERKLIICMISYPDTNDDNVGTMLDEYLDLILPIIEGTGLEY